MCKFLSDFFLFRDGVLLRDCTNAEAIQIAQKGIKKGELCIGMQTVISHRRHIAAKLNTHSTAGLTVYAIVNKLVDINNLE